MSSPEPPIGATEPKPPTGPGGPEIPPPDPGNTSPKQPGRPDPWMARVGLVTVALVVVVTAGSWYLLKELAPILRPLLLGVVLCYVILPSHYRLARYIPPAAADAVLAIGSAGLLALLVWLLVGSVAQLNEDMPALVKRGEFIVNEARDHILSQLPRPLANQAEEVMRGQSQLLDCFKQFASSLAGSTAGLFGEVILVGIYLIFLLMEAGRYPRRVQRTYCGEHAERILTVISNINAAIVGYLRAKVKASLCLAVPVTLLLWAFGVRFAPMWGVLTFFFSFIPYLSIILGCSGPILLAFLEMDSFAQPALVAGLLIGIHLFVSNVVEPSLTGKAVGLSPLVILVMLAFWGLCWGLIGMILAVPVTVMIKIVLENRPFTRPFARLISEE
jgi:AI-2 transport protein TqsA